METFAYVHLGLRIFIVSVNVAPGASVSELELEEMLVYDAGIRLRFTSTVKSLVKEPPPEAAPPPTDWAKFWHQYVVLPTVTHPMPT